MRISSLLGALGLAALSSADRIHRDYERNDYYVLHLDDGASPDLVATRLGLRHEGALGAMHDHHVFRSLKSDHDVVKREIQQNKLRKRSFGEHDVLDGVLLSTKQEARHRLHKRVIPPPPEGLVTRQAKAPPDPAAVKVQSDVMQQLQISDPIFREQWHLFNPVQLGHDINVTGVWLEGITGKNSTVAIIDDGLDMGSNDLKGNYYPEGSYDFNEGSPEPRPRLADDHHGTRCAGEVAAVRNDVCGVGVAYDAKIAGIRILSKPISDADEAEAVLYKYDHNQIYSCSWGPRDDGRTMEAPGILIRRAMLKAIQEGRDGRGSIYVFASGNGAASDDNCNFDGYTNSIYSITVGAVDRAGKHPYYSEHCSAQLVVTYSSGSGDSIHTTDLGVDKCTDSHGGTSAAAPLAAGIFALVLEVRPELSWRDLQYLAMDTAKPVADTQDAAWQSTAVGKKFSHVFGYGKIDSYDMIQRAKTWELVKPQAWYFSPWLHVNKAIPQGKHGLIVSFDVTEEMIKEANVARLEHVTVTMNLNHTRRGDVNVDLISPKNVISHLSTARKDDEYSGGYDDWTFMSVAHWGESGVGRWNLVVYDTHENDHEGVLIDWHLKLWGEAQDAGKATKLPMPTEDDDADHDKIETVTPPAATTTIALPDDGHSHPTSNPTDHPERPTKPTGEPGSGTSDADESETSTPSSWISKFPSFGASKTAQIWIYGALVLIVLFCACLGLYFWIVRRRRLRNDPRNTYDFELLDEEDREGGDGVEKTRRRTRGGELYDAFAGGSEDEDEFDEYSDRSAERRTDEQQHIVGEESDDDDNERPLGSGSR